MRQLIFVILIVSPFGFSQSKIEGRVFQQSSGWTPIEGIFVTEENSNGDYSKRDGSFSLEFNSKKLGEIVYPKIGLNGDNFAKDKNGKVWELVNVNELSSVIIPKDPKRGSLKIIVCPKGGIHEAAINYYKPMKNFRDKKFIMLNDSLKTLQVRLSSDHQVIIDLNRQIERYKKLNDSIRLYSKALDYARTNLDSAEKRVKDYLEALGMGMQIEQAIKILDEEKAKKEARLHGQGFETSIDELRKIAEQKELDFRFQEAVKIYDEIILQYTEYNKDQNLILDLYYYICDMHLQIGQYSKVIQYGKKALLILNDIRYDKNNPKKSQLLNVLGVAYMNIYDYDNSKTSLDESLKINEFRINHKLTKSQLPVFDNLTNLGNLNLELKQFKEAELYYEKALNIYLNFKDENYHKDPNRLVSIYNNLAVINQNIFNDTKTIEYLRKALSILKLLRDKKDSRKLKQSFADLNTNLGNLFKDSNDLNSALKHFGQAKDIYEELNLEEPFSFVFSYSIALNNFVSVLLNLNRVSEAKNYIEISINLNKELVLRYPSELQYKHNIAFSYSNLGRLYCLEQSYSKSIDAYKESIGLLKEFDISTTNSNQEMLLSTINDLALVYNSNHQCSNAEKVLLEAMQLLHKRDSDFKYSAPLSLLLRTNLGISLDCQKKHELAEDNNQIMLKISRELAKENLSRFGIDILGSLNNLSISLMNNGKRIKAKELLLEAVVLSQNMKGIDFEMGSINHNLGKVYDELEKYDKSIDHYLQACQIRKKLVFKNDIALFKKDLATSLNNLGNVYVETGDYVRAKSNLILSKNIREELAKENDINEYDLAKSRFALGLLYYKSKKNDNALLEFSEAQKLFYNPIFDHFSQANLYRAKINTEVGKSYIRLEKFELAKKNLLETFLKFESKIKQHSLTTEESSLFLKNLIYLTRIDILRNLKEELSLQDAKKGFERIQFTLSQKNTKINFDNQKKELLVLFKGCEEFYSGHFIDLEASELMQKIDLDKDKIGLYQELKIFLAKLDQFGLQYPNNEGVQVYSLHFRANLSWYALFAKDFVFSERCAKYVLEKEPSEEWVYTNLALSYVFQDKFQQAKNIYLKYKDQPYDNTNFREVFLDDIMALENEGLAHQDFAKVREILEKR
ncbi:tetratricopeptide repeat protein [Flavivirga eckloniae]|uniref:Tetratricopeptide repeat protein n=1 Tax=Flavivirga eckloniae TaxID=1803846 RepID=A0A2K9PW07_9FLAO|nr:tetratricopeptide repeat protein [Flavivirga eckloniae]AUP81230.1 hypothetical protein C1H87_21935 [Flavivirga eckloniae]